MVRDAKGSNEKIGKRGGYGQRTRAEIMRSVSFVSCKSLQAPQVTSFIPPGYTGQHWSGSSSLDAAPKSAEARPSRCRPRNCARGALAPLRRRGPAHAIARVCVFGTRASMETMAEWCARSNLRWKLLSRTDLRPVRDNNFPSLQPGSGIGPLSAQACLAMRAPVKAGSASTCWSALCAAPPRRRRHHGEEATL